MTVEAFSTLRGLVRRAIRDTGGALFADAVLDRMINDAQRETASLTGSLRGSARVTANRSGVLRCPEDFISPVKFIGTDHIEKPFYSWKYLHEQYPDFRNISGTELRGIIADFDGFGKIRLFPKLPEGTEAGTLYYRRFPAPDVLETTNQDAVVKHCLFQAFLLADNSSASLYYRDFMSAVNGESSIQRGLKAHSPVRRGRFF